MSDSDIAAYVDMWLAIKPYINPKDKELACGKLLAVINEHLFDLSEVGDEWFGNDATMDKIIREEYMEEDIFDDYDSEEGDNW